MAIKELDWDLALNQRVRIYRNLNNGRMSLQLKVGKSWKVMGHITDCIISNVIFKVSEAGRLRVIRDGCKNVHAWGEGILISQFDMGIYASIDLGYNPYANSTFVERETENAITRCSFLVVRENQVFCSPDAIGGNATSLLTVIDGGRSKKGQLHLPNNIRAIAA